MSKNKLIYLNGLSVDELETMIAMAVSKTMKELSEQAIPNPGDQFLRISHVCEMLNISRPTVYSWMKIRKNGDEELPPYLTGYKFNGLLFFNKEDIVNLLKNKKNTEQVS